jgi:nucleoside-diphosphate-sugar epimerase
MESVFITGGSGFVGRNLIQALRDRGYRVRAAARSEQSAKVVSELGADPVSADLDAVDPMSDAMKGCAFVVHAAAKVEDCGRMEDFMHVNVIGTDNVMTAAKRAGVPRFVHVSTEAVLVGGPPLVQVDESRPRPAHTPGLYPHTKGLAEDRVRAASSDTFQTMAVRPRFIWGRGDTSLMPKLVEMVRTKQFAWISGGHYLTSTCHVANVCEGIALAAQRGQGGQVYFLTDGPPVEFRAFISDLIRTQGLAPPTRSIPRTVARPIASLLEGTWRLLSLQSPPPMTRTMLALVGEEVTVNDGKARRDLGYREVMTREKGLAEMGTAAPPVTRSSSESRPAASA